jgi:hypothetical protein
LESTLQREKQRKQRRGCLWKVTPIRVWNMWCTLGLCSGYVGEGYDHSGLCHSCTHSQHGHIILSVTGEIHNNTGKWCYILGCDYLPFLYWMTVTWVVSRHLHSSGLGYIPLLWMILCILYLGQLSLITFILLTHVAPLEVDWEAWTQCVYSSLGISVLHLLESYSSMHIMVAMRSYLHGLMCMVKEKFKLSFSKGAVSSSGFQELVFIVKGCGLWKGHQFVVWIFASWSLTLTNLGSGLAHFALHVDIWALLIFRPYWIPVQDWYTSLCMWDKKFLCKA